MPSPPNSPEPAELKLTQSEGRRLQRLIEQRIGRGPNGHDPELLEAIDEKLSDANALARWLRENVLLELRRREAAELLGVLSEPPPSDHRTMTTIRDQLRRLTAPDPQDELTPNGR